MDGEARVLTRPRQVATEVRKSNIDLRIEGLDCRNCNSSEKVTHISNLKSFDKQNATPLPESFRQMFGQSRGTDEPAFQKR
jgi:hypothetical protein